MDWCQQIGEWIRQNIEQPVEQFLRNLWQSCAAIRQWVEQQILEPIDTWVQQWEQQCREQACNWWCLCCNKWLCWLVSVLVHVIEWVIRIVGEWLVEIICRIIVTIIVVIVTIIMQVLKWLVLAVVCLFAKLCSFLFLLAGIALIVVLLCLVALAAPPFAPIAAPILPVAAVGAVVAFALAKVLCEAGRCRLLGVVAWALKWAITLGAVLTLIALSPLSALVVAIMGGCLAALIHLMLRLGCPVPRLLAVP